MTGLREALEALLKDRESSTSTHPNDHMVAPYELRELLKEYPEIVCTHDTCCCEHCGPDCGCDCKTMEEGIAKPRRGNYGGAL